MCAVLVTGQQEGCENSADPENLKQKQKVLEAHNSLGSICKSKTELTFQVQDASSE